jgi:hypothetical protein
MPPPGELLQPSRVSLRGFAMPRMGNDSGDDRHDRLDFED